VAENTQEIIRQYFPELSAEQLNRMAMLEGLYREWNARINVISRQDIDNLTERHILHSLSIARIIPFRPGTKVLDAGTGGGFPGIPLAIFYPDVSFQLVDSTAKKLTVVKDIAQSAGLKNVTTQHIRLEELRDKYDFVVSRAVATLDQMVDWTWKNIQHKEDEAQSGLLYLRGGAPEVLTNKTIRQKIYPLGEYFREPFFETKHLVHLF
jgi:16S rRNA (guanine527-N7)-methyltransferase